MYYRHSSSLRVFPPPRQPPARASATPLSNLPARLTFNSPPNSREDGWNIWRWWYLHTLPLTVTFSTLPLTQPFHFPSPGRVKFLHISASERNLIVQLTHCTTDNMRFAGLIVFTLSIITHIAQCAPLAVHAMAIAPRSASYSVVQVNGGSTINIEATETTTTTVYTTVTDQEPIPNTAASTTPVVVLETETLIYTSTVTKAKAAQTVVVTTTVLVYAGTPSQPSTIVASNTTSAILTSTTASSTSHNVALPTTQTIISTTTTTINHSQSAQNVTITATATSLEVVALAPITTVIITTQAAQTSVYAIMVEVEGTSGGLTAIPMSTVIPATTVTRTATIYPMQTSSSCTTSATETSTTTLTYDIVSQTFTSIPTSTITWENSTAPCTKLHSPALPSSTTYFVHHERPWRN